MPIMGEYQGELERTFDPDEPEAPKTEEQLEAEDVSYFEGVSAGFRKDELAEGIDVDEPTRKLVFSKYSNYKEEQAAYDAYADLTSVWKSKTSESVMRAQIDRAVESGRFTLGSDGKVIDSDTSWINDSFMYDMDAVKGALLAKANGFDDVQFKAGYKEYTAIENKKLENTIANAPLSAPTVGAIGNYLYSKEGLVEVLGSPTKIVGKTIARMALKRGGAEALLAMIGGVSREQRKINHAIKADLNYGLADAAENVLWEMGLAAGLSSAGSIVLDNITWAKVRSRMKEDGKWGEIDATSKEILERFFRREEYKLTRSSIKHEDLMIKTEADIDDGRAVNVSDELDTPIETKLPEDFEATDLSHEVTLARIESGVDDEIATIEKELDEVPEFTTADYETKYGSMADDAEGDKIIQEVGELDPEIKAEADAIEAEIARIEGEAKAQTVKEDLATATKLNEAEAVVDEAKLDTGSDEYGEMMSEGEAPRKSGFQSKTMTINGVDIPKTQFDLIQKYQKNRKFNRKNPGKKRAIPKSQQDAYTKYSDVADDIEDVEFKEGDSIDARDAGNVFFSQGIDNLAVATYAGVGEDENGNITFDPAAFAAGLGGYTAAKKVLTNAKVQKEFKDWAMRRLDEFEDTRTGKAVTGKQNIVEEAKMKLDPKLYATHRTNINNISRMLDVGVLPAPSFALARNSSVSDKFGDIVMIPKEKHINPKKGASVFGGDAWTPRIKFDPNEEMEVLDLKAPVFDMFPKFKAIAKDAYDRDDFYNQIINEERTVSWVDKWSRGRFDTYEAASRIADQIFKTEKPSLENKIKQIKKLIRDNGGDMRGLEDAFTPSYIDTYKQYFDLESVAERGKELKTFKNQDKFYSEAEKAMKKGEQAPADYMEAKRIDLVALDDLDRIIVPSDQYDAVIEMFKDKGIKVDIIKQRKNESTNSAIKRSSSGKSNFIYGGAAIGLIPLFNKEETN